MRNLKKFLALVLAMLMVVSASAAVSAYDDVDDDNAYAEAIATLTEYGIVNGIGGNLFGVEDSIERYQMALMMARALNPAETDWATGMSVFDDVDEWYGAIAYAYMNGIVTGIGNNQFAPHEGIKYQDALIMAVRALGYKVDVSGDPYWLAAYNQAQALGLTKNVAVYKGEQVLNRAETAQVITNMIKATPADGGATIEAKNFGVATVENTTTFVITATKKQYFAETYKVTEDGYVGIQALVNGVPSGNVIYKTCDELGIDEAEIEDYFFYAVDLVNYNETTTTFDSAIIGKTPDVVYSTAVTASDTTLSIDSVKYYTTEQVTGAALKNELVVFDGGANATAAKMLLTNKDGDIVNYNGEIVATFAYQTASGAKYYVDKDVAEDAKVISEAVALGKYGVKIDDGTYTKYATKTASELKGQNYQLTLFDDNGDNKYDRAVVTAVYMSVYNSKDGDKINITSDAFEKTEKGITLNKSLTKGDVFVYTYNKQTKVINVIDVLEVQTGIIKKLDLSNYKSQSNANNWLAKISILTDDGVEVYKIGNTAQEQYIGANLCETTKPSSFSEIASKPYIQYRDTYLNNSDLVTDSKGYANIESPIKYVAYNGYIIYAETYQIDTAFDYMVVNKMDDALTDKDGNFLVDAYINGVRDVYAISKIYDTTKKSYVALSDMNAIAYSSTLKNFYDDCVDAIYRCVKIGDTYQISDELKINDPASLTAFDLYEANADKYVFNDGISDEISGKGQRIRTNASTKFYFFDTDKKTVALYTGALADNYTIDATLSGVKVFAKRIGYGTDTKRNGVASIVVVYYTDAKTQIMGFDITSNTNSYVYIANPGTYTVDSAANLGLTGMSGTYFAYGAVAIDLAKGETMKVYSKDLLKRGYYIVDGLGIATEMTAAEILAKIETATLTKSQLDLNNQYYNITGIATTANKVTKLITYKYNDITAKKTNSADHFSTTSETVAYLKNDTADGIVVLIVGADATPIVTPDPTTGVANATAKWGTTLYGAIYTATGIGTGKVTMYNDQVGIDGTVTLANVWTDALDAGAVYSVVIDEQVDGVWTNSTNYTDTYALATYADGVLTVNGFVMKDNHNVPVTLVDGTYRITVTVNKINGQVTAITYYVG